MADSVDLRIYTTELTRKLTKHSKILHVKFIDFVPLRQFAIAFGICVL